MYWVFVREQIPSHKNIVPERTDHRPEAFIVIRIAIIAIQRERTRIRSIIRIAATEEEQPYPYIYVLLHKYLFRERLTAQKISFQMFLYNSILSLLKLRSD
jgi:hypothetical protein